MTKSPLHIVILAAGQGTRMKSRLPKVLHAVGGRPLLGHVIDTALALDAAAVHVVHGHGAAEVREWFERAYPGEARVRFVLQAEQKGTAHAVDQAMPGVPDAARVLVLYGDVPLIRTGTLESLLAATDGGVALLTTRLHDPGGYGRIVRDREGDVTGVVEDKDATSQQRAIREVNTGVLALGAKLLKRWLPRVRTDNAKGEYYLTDIVGMAARAAVSLSTIEADPDDVEGVNDRAQLARIERRFQRRQAEALQRQGLAIRDSERFDLRGQVRFGTDCAIETGVILEGDIELGDNVQIGAYCVLRDVKLGSDTIVRAHSVLDSVATGRNCRIGPFARLRPETVLADEVHVGNFVEVKKTTLGEGSKANHLAYLGDGAVGAGVNVGAGVIFCNYDGAAKHRTVIHDGAFIGSDTQLVAPVTVGENATIGAGSTITRDVPGGGLTVSRAKEQKTYPDWKRPRKPGGRKSGA